MGVEDASRPEEDDDLTPFQIRRRWESRCIKQERLLKTYTVHISLLFMKKLENYLLPFFCFKHDQMLDAVNVLVNLGIILLKILSHGWCIILFTFSSQNTNYIFPVI